MRSVSLLKLAAGLLVALLLSVAILQTRWLPLVSLSPIVFGAPVAPLAGAADGSGRGADQGR